MSIRKLDGNAMASRLGLRKRQSNKKALLQQGSDTQDTLIIGAGASSSKTRRKKGKRKIKSSSKYIEEKKPVESTAYTIPLSKPLKKTTSILLPTSRAAILESEQEKVEEWKAKLKNFNQEQLDEIRRLNIKVKDISSPLLPSISHTTKYRRRKLNTSVLLSENQNSEVAEFESSAKGNDGSTGSDLTTKQRYLMKVNQSSSTYERRNVISHRPLTPLGTYISECKALNILPEPLIAKASESGDGKLNLRSYGIGPKSMTALSKSLGMMLRNLTEICLADNRLGDTGVSSLLNSALTTSESTTTLQLLDISSNKIRATGGICIAKFLSSAVTTQILHLNLENNRLGDRGVSSVANALQFTSIKVLNLSKCGISKSGAIALGTALGSTSTTLKELYLSWNKIHQYGAVALLNGVERCTSLNVLDLSWNSIGCETNTDAVVALSYVLSNNSTLLHLDISHNRLSTKDCTDIGLALVSNHTILGLHVGGNEMDLDAYGFIIPSAAAYDPVDAHIFTRINAKHRTKSWSKRSNCWICEKWTETRFYIKSDLSEEDLYIQTEFDYWKPHLMQPTGEPGCFELYRMVPPGSSQYFYSTAGSNSGSFIDIESLVQDFEKRTVCGVSNTTNSVVLPDRVNVITTKRRDDCVDITLEPRYFVQKANDGNWFPSSVFASYVQDSSEMLKTAFEFDWNISRLPNILKDNDAVQLQLIKDTLFQHYGMIKNVFKQYSSNGGDPFTMGSNSFSDFVSDCNIIDEQNCLRTEVEMSFITANLSGPKDKANPKRSLLRFQFLEIIATLALSKFYSSKDEALVVCSNTPHEAVVRMLNEFIKPNATWHDAQAYRGEDNNGRIYSRENDQVFKDHLCICEGVFDIYAASQQKNSIIGRKKRMAVGEFMAMVDDIGLTDETLASREVRMAVLYSKQTHVNEIAEHESVRSLDFTEFLEACARIADMKDMTGMYQRLVAESSLEGDNTSTTSSTIVKKILEEITSYTGDNSTSITDWTSGDAGNLTLKLQLLLKMLAIPVSHRRRGVLPSKLVSQATELEKLFVI